MIPFYQVEKTSSKIVCIVWHSDQDRGPIPPQYHPGDNYDLVPGGEDFTREGQLDTTTPYLIDGEVVWVNADLTQAMVDVAVAQTYSDVDEVYQAAVGLRVSEYTNAENAARAYLAADPKPDVVSDYITGHAQHNPTGEVQSNEWAAQQIVERADAFRWAELQMRNVRFARQSDMRIATTVESLAAAVASWKDFVTWLRTLLDV